MPLSPFATGDLLRSAYQPLSHRLKSQAISLKGQYRRQGIAPDLIGKMPNTRVDSIAFLAPHSSRAPGQPSAKSSSTFFGLDPQRAHPARYSWHWAEPHGNQDLEDIEPITVAAYGEMLGRQVAPLTVKQHIAAIR